MYTYHGHHINGTTKEAPQGRMVVSRCGGPGVCSPCSKEAYLALKTEPPPKKAAVVDEKEVETVIYDNGDRVVIGKATVRVDGSIEIALNETSDGERMHKLIAGPNLMGISFDFFPAQPQTEFVRDKVHFPMLERVKDEVEGEQNG